MLGKSGVQVYIDGKPSPLTGDDLAAFLKSMQASEIDNIEIITNPSAKYDAQGTPSKNCPKRVCDSPISRSGILSVCQLDLCYFYWWI